MTQLGFSRDEFRRAFALTAVSDAEASAMADALCDALHDPDAGITVMDGTFLLLAALSDDIAARVVDAVPRLRDEVARIRADPDDFIRRARDTGD